MTIDEYLSAQLTLPLSAKANAQTRESDIQLICTNDSGIRDCLNPDKINETYKLGEMCDPASFNDTCSGLCKPTTNVGNVSEDIIMTCDFTQYHKVSGISNWMQWFNLFGFYWAMNFVTSYGEMVLGGVFAKWYWTKRDDRSQIVCCVPLLKSIRNATLYHLGTIAFGSFIIAIIKVGYRVALKIYILIPTEGQSNLMKTNVSPQLYFFLFSDGTDDCQLRRI